MLTERFWRWLHARCERRIAGFYSSSRRCPRCLTWTHMVPPADYRTNDPDEVHDTMVCGKCGHQSIWLMVYMLPVSVGAGAGIPSKNVLRDLREIAQAGMAAGADKQRALMAIEGRILEEDAATA